MSGIAPEQPDLEDERVLGRDVRTRLAWLASAATEDEARLIESALIVQTDNRPHDGDPEEEPDR
jgi:hypothetical protein